MEEKREIFYKMIEKIMDKERNFFWEKNQGPNTLIVSIKGFELLFAQSGLVLHKINSTKEGYTFRGMAIEINKDFNDYFDFKLEKR